VSTQKDVAYEKETYACYKRPTWKDMPYNPSKETYNPSKETYNPSKETYYPSKETRYPSKETYLEGHGLRKSASLAAKGPDCVCMCVCVCVCMCMCVCVRGLYVLVCVFVSVL